MQQIELSKIKEALILSLLTSHMKTRNATYIFVYNNLLYEIIRTRTTHLHCGLLHTQINKEEEEEEKIFRKVEHQ